MSHSHSSPIAVCSFSLEPTPPVPVIVPAKLSEVELLLIICALLFLTLLLLGIGIAYYCLKRRNIKVVRKRKVLSLGPGSEITKLSHSTIFDQVKIPRATAQSSSGSEPLVPSIPSDYPSESPSSDERRSVISEESTIRHDHFQYQNSAFVPEPYPLDIEKEESVTSLPVPVVAKPNYTALVYDTTLLTTQHFTEEDEHNTHHKKTTTKLYRKVPTPFRYRRKPASIPDNENRSVTEFSEDLSVREPYLSSTAPSLYGSIPDNDDWSHSEVEEGPQKVRYVEPPRLDAATTEDRYVTNLEENDLDEDTTVKRVIKYPPPKIVVKNIEDLFVTNIHETEVLEDRLTVAKKPPKPPGPPRPKALEPLSPKRTTHLKSVEDVSSTTRDERYVDDRYRSSTEHTEVQHWQNLDQLKTKMQQIQDRRRQVDVETTLREEIMEEYSNTLTLMFYHFDKQRTGRLVHRDFNSCLRALGYDLPPYSEERPDAEFTTILNAVDPHRHGYVLLPNYVSYMISREFNEYVTTTVYATSYRTSGGVGGSNNNSSLPPLERFHTTATTQSADERFSVG